LDTAAEHIEKSLTNYDAEFDMILANAWLLRGKIHDMNGNREEAKAAYRNCRKLDNNTEAIVLAKKYLKKPFRQKKIVDN
jgi:hypothetical protein